MGNKILQWFIGLWDNSPTGASMRKVLAVWIMVLLTRIHDKYLATSCTIIDGKVAGDFAFAQTLLYVDYSVILLLLGLIVFQDIIKLKNGGGDKDPPDKAATQV